MTTFTTPEQFAAASKANVETALSLTKSGFDRAERLAALNLNTARAALEDGVANIRTLSSIKNAQELVDLQSSLFQPMFDKSVAYARSVYAIAVEGQQELVKLFEAQVAELNKTVAVVLDEAAKSAPAGSESVISALKSAVAANNSVYENANKAVKQLVEVAESNVAAATEATTKIVRAKKAA